MDERPIARVTSSELLLPHLRVRSTFHADLLRPVRLNRQALVKSTCSEGRVRDWMSILITRILHPPERLALDRHARYYCCINSTQIKHFLFEI